MLTAGSLFSGIGGIDLAFSLAGFDIRYQVEINPFCRKVLRKHARNYWRNAIQYTDVQQCGMGRAETLPYTDVIFGGFPCQDISNAGHHAGIREGTRSGLWYEFLRLIGEIRPRAVLLENVEAIIHKGRGGTGVIADLAKMGYVGQWGIISASDAEAPHKRDRWFAVAYAAGDGQPGQRHAGELPHVPDRHIQRGQQPGQTDIWAVKPAGKAMGYAESNTNPRIAGSVVASPGEATEQENGRIVKRAGQNRGRYCGPVKSRLGRDADGVSAGMDRLMQHQFPAPPGGQFESEPPRTTRDRSEERLAALGNAVVPQVVYPIAKLLHEVLS